MHKKIGRDIRVTLNVQFPRGLCGSDTHVSCWAASFSTRNKEDACAIILEIDDRHITSLICDNRRSCTSVGDDNVARSGRGCGD